MTLLSTYQGNSEYTRAEVAQLAERFNVQLLKTPATECLYTTLCVTSNNCWTARLSEFPGNCSSLVLSNIQDGIPNNKAAIEDIMAFSIAMCEYMEYGALFASGTTDILREYLEGHGFEPALEGLMNPHSGSRNTFYVKKFFQPKEKDV